MSPVFPNFPWFKQKLEEGRVYEEYVAEKLRERGLIVEVPPLRYRRDDQDTLEFAAQEDIRVSRPGGTPAVVEVKSYDYPFWSPDDWPGKKDDPERWVMCYETSKPWLNAPVLWVSTQTMVILGVLDDGSLRYERDMTRTRYGHTKTDRIWAVPFKDPKTGVCQLITFDQWVDRVGEYLME